MFVSLGFVKCFFNWDYVKYDGRSNMDPFASLNLEQTTRRNCRGSIVSTAFTVFPIFNFSVTEFMFLIVVAKLVTLFFCHA